MTRNRARGVRRHGAGWQASVFVSGTLYCKQFPLPTPLEDMQAWRERTRIAKHIAKPNAGTLAADAERYLKAVAAMPTIGERTRHIELWVDALGPTRWRGSITTDEISTILHQWRLTGGPNGTPLSDTTVRHRRTALLHLWHTLDGKDEPNPVRRSWKPKDPKPAARALSPETITRILDAMPECKTKARLRVMATTGLPHTQVMQIHPASDFDAAGARLRVRGRKKGDGTGDRWLPLSAAGVAALETFVAAKATGTFSASSVYKSWQLACRKVGVTNARPYDLKHSFGTLLYQASHDLAAVARLLDVSMTTAQRYTLGAHETVDRAVIQKAGS